MLVHEGKYCSVTLHNRETDSLIGVDELCFVNPSFRFDFFFFFLNIISISDLIL